MSRTRPHNPWHDAFAFFLLVSSTLVIVLVLLSTRHYFESFDLLGKTLAVLVVVGAFLVLATLAISLLRLYIRPAFDEGRQRIGEAIDEADRRLQEGRQKITQRTQRLAAAAKKRRSRNP